MSSNIILEGDCRVLAEQIDRPINCILTDPPYGVNFVSNSGSHPTNEKFARPIEDDDDPEKALLLFRQVMAKLLPKCADECELYVFTNWNVLDTWMPRLRNIPGFQLKQMLIWAKGYPGMGDVDANWGCGHEIILYLKKGRRPIPERRSGILAVERLATRKNIHPTEKPVQLLEILLRMSTDVGDFVVDPFSGSGSTSVAARNLGRDSLAFELDPQYVAAGRSRLEQDTLFSGT